MTSCHAFLLIVKPATRMSPSVLNRTALSESLKTPSDPQSFHISVNPHLVGHLPPAFARRPPAWHSVLTRFELGRYSSVGKEEQDTRKIPAMDRYAEALPSFPCPHPDGQRAGAESQEVRRPGQHEAGTLEVAVARVYRRAVHQALQEISA